MAMPKANTRIKRHRLARSLTGDGVNMSRTLPLEELRGIAAKPAR